MKERMGKMEKQMVALVETTRRNLSSQLQINTTYASVLRGAAPPTPLSSSPPSGPIIPTRVTNLLAPITQQMPPAIEIDLTEASVDTTKPGEIRAQL